MSVPSDSPARSIVRAPQVLCTADRGPLVWRPGKQISCFTVRPGFLLLVSQNEAALLNTTPALAAVSELCAVSTSGVLVGSPLSDCSLCTCDRRWPSPGKGVCGLQRHASVLPQRAPRWRGAAGFSTPGVRRTPILPGARSPAAAEGQQGSFISFSDPSDLSVRCD